MSPILYIIIDTDVELVDAYIFTPGQGICLEKLSGPFEKEASAIGFNKGLAYGSWYDVLIRINNSQNQETYMKKGIYLKVNKFVQLSDILRKKMILIEKTNLNGNVRIRAVKNGMTVVLKFACTVPLIAIAALFAAFRIFLF
jgi:hypothetical protein